MSKRNIRDIEREIINQILISEVCFDICRAIPTLPGRGSDFLPFYYNLNFSKGIISLHSLLLSNQKSELSIKNFLKQYKTDYPSEDITGVEAKIATIAETFGKILPVSLRHKVAAHIDQEFKHTDFTSAYIIPESVEKYVAIVSDLKDAIFAFTNYARNDYPHRKILEQSKDVFEKIVRESDKGYSL